MFDPTSRFNSIIYRPGGVSAGDVVATWPEVQSFIQSSSNGKCIVYVDNTIVPLPLVPGVTGITNCFGRVELRPFLVDSSVFVTLQIEAGATLLDLYAIVAMEVRCNPTTATPSLDFSSPVGGDLLITQFGLLSNAATATTPAIIVPGGSFFVLLCDQGQITSSTFTDFTVPLISQTVGSSTEVFATDGSLIAGNIAAGAGNFQLEYDNATAQFFTVPGTPPTEPGIGVYTTKNIDDIVNAQTLLVSTLNIFSAGPKTGIRPVTFSGCGGGGGGGGGAGGSAASGAGSGGGAGGAARFKEVTINVDFSHPINAVIGAAGAAGVAGAGGGGLGGNGGDGQVTYILDSITNVVLCAFMGASGGTGGNVTNPSSGGASFPSSQFVTTNSVPSNEAFLAAGGGGGAGGNLGAASPGEAGNFNDCSFGKSLPGLPTWSGGIGGAAGGVGEGGGGGGGGQGPFGDGGAGGVGNATTGTAGAAPTANSGAGGGGGGGGALAGSSAGSAGAVGGSGQISSSYRP